MRAPTCRKPWPVILLAAVLGICACSHKTPRSAQPQAQAAAPLVTAVPAVRATVPIYQDFVGQTQAVNTVEIRAQVGGFLQSIDFTEGATVDKGQLLFQIDPREYQAAVQQAQAKRAQTQAALNNDEKNLERDRILYKRQVVARQTLDTAEALVKEDRANVAAAEAALDQAQLNLGYTRIYAPIRGRIGVAQVRVGGLVQAGTTLLDTIYSINPIYVNFSVTEQTYLRYAERVARADHMPPPPPVQLILPGDKAYEYEGKIDMSTPAVNTSTGTLGVRAVFPNPQGILRAGLYVRVRLMVRRERNAVVVPVQAITAVQGQQYVLIVGKGDKVGMRPVKIGSTIDKMKVIASGVSPGDLVITEGLLKARPGMTVRVEEHAPPPIPGMETATGGQPAPRSPTMADAQAARTPAPAASPPTTAGPTPAASPAR